MEWAYFTETTPNIILDVSIVDSMTIAFSTTGVLSLIKNDSHAGAKEAPKILTIYNYQSDDYENWWIPFTRLFKQDSKFSSILIYTHRSYRYGKNSHILLALVAF